MKPPVNLAQFSSLDTYQQYGKEDKSKQVQDKKTTNVQAVGKHWLKWTVISPEAS